MKILAIDIGTSGCRGLYVERSSIIDNYQYKYETHYTDEGYVEHEPNIILTTVLDIIEECLNKHTLDAVILDSYMHSMLLLDADGRPLTNVSLWNDKRAADLCAKYSSIYHTNGWHHKTGCLISSTYPLWRLLWFKEHSHHIFADTRHVVSIKSYIIYCLTKQYVEDCSIASGTGLFNLLECDWDTELLEFIGIHRNLLPDVVPVDFTFPEATIPGLNYDNKKFTLIVGGADGPMAHFGSAGGLNASASLTLGTSAAIRVSTRIPVVSRENSIWCYCLTKDLYISGIASNNCGNVVDWYLEKHLFNSIGWDDLCRMLSRFDIKSNLLATPYVFPERDGSSLSASIQGLCHQHSFNDVIRAIIEGIVFNMVLNLEKITRNFIIDEVNISGSIAKLPFVRALIKAISPVSVNSLVVANASLQGSLRLITGADIFVNESYTPELIFSTYENALYYDKYVNWKSSISIS